MPRICCIPQCSNSTPAHHLFAVPNKEFCAGEKRAWADTLEKVVSGLREDPYIKVLFQKDRVKICEEHFESQCIFKSKLILICDGTSLIFYACFIRYLILHSVLT